MLPWLTMAVFANIGGWIADTLISKGFSITTVRKASICYSLCAYISQMGTFGRSISPSDLRGQTCITYKFHFPHVLIVTDNAVDWIFRPSFFPHTAEQSEDTCFSCAMHGL